MGAEQSAYRVAFTVAATYWTRRAIGYVGRRMMQPSVDSLQDSNTSDTKPPEESFKQAQETLLHDQHAVKSNTTQAKPIPDLAFQPTQNFWQSKFPQPSSVFGAILSQYNQPKVKPQDEPSLGR